MGLIRVEVFPLPAKEKLRLRLQSQVAQELAIEILSLQGRVVYQHHSPPVYQLEHGINTQQLPQGHHLLRIRTKQGVWTKPIQIMQN